MYEMCGGAYKENKHFIYSVLDWKEKLQRAIVISIIVVVLSPLAHIFFCSVLYRVRKFIYHQARLIMNRNTTRSVD